MIFGWRLAQRKALFERISICRSWFNYILSNERPFSNGFAGEVCPSQSALTCWTRRQGLQASNFWGFGGLDTQDLYLCSRISPMSKHALRFLLNENHTSPEQLAPSFKDTLSAEIRLPINEKHGNPAFPAGEISGSQWGERRKDIKVTLPRDVRYSGSLISIE